MLEGPESGVASPRPFTVFIRDTSNTDGVLVDGNVRGGGMEQVEGVPELDVFRAVFLADVECGADFLHFLLRTKWPQTLELGIVEGQTDRDDLGQEVKGNEGAVVVINMVYVDIRVTVDRRSDSLIPSRVEDSRRQIVHTSGIWVRLGLSTEDGGIQNDVGDVVQDVFLNLDEVGLSEDDDFDRFDRLARGILEILDFRDDPDQIDIRHRFTHQTRHDTETSDLDLELPVDDLVFQRRDQNLSSLVLVLRPTDNLCLFVARETKYIFDASAVVVVFLARQQ